MFAHPLFGTRGMAPGADRRTLYIQNLRRDASIGVYDHEQTQRQAIVVDLAVLLDDPALPVDDRLDRVLDYSRLRQAVVELIDSRHFGLQETLCEALADLCLTHAGVASAYVRVGKLQAFADCDAIGCELWRTRASPAMAAVAVVTAP
jgi:7,8-dihydroneopterin aldolase/epimerase/oxygenase